jgi:methanogenic corrinoid protein MtbC1
MAKTQVLERYLSGLLEGDRSYCRTIIEETLQSGIPANQVYMDVIWPIMNEIDRLYRRDIISSAQESFATRINRMIVDQLQNKLPRKPQVAKRIVVCSAASEQGELGAQMIADFFESNGWDVRFLGSSVNNDDIAEFVQTYQPDILVIYGMQAKKAPDMRLLIDKLRTINACPQMRIMLSGGVFDRAEGLWEEIGADLYAETASEAIRIANAHQEDVPTPRRTINRRKRRKEETLPTETAQAESTETENGTHESMQVTEQAEPVL